MIKFILTVIAGIVFGLIVHLVAVLAIPRLAADHLERKYDALGQTGVLNVFAAPGPGEANPLGFDPEMVYAACRFNLSEGPGVFSGELPADFWSLGLFDEEGVAVYSTTNRSGVGNSLVLGVFNAAQSSLLRQQEFEIQQGMLIVEAPSDIIIAVLRLSVPYHAMQPRYLEALKNLDCGHIGVPAAR